MALDKVKLTEKLKSLSPEDRETFKMVLGEIDPPDPESSLSPEEIFTIRELITRKTKKKPGFLETLDSIFDG